MFFNGLMWSASLIKVLWALEIRFVVYKFPHTYITWL